MSATDWITFFVCIFCFGLGFLVAYYMYKYVPKPRPPKPIVEKDTYEPYKEE